MNEAITCPSCQSSGPFVKSGVIKDRQRYHCKACNYHFTVLKQGKSIDPYYVVKALQLHMEGVSYREIERLLGVSHVTVLNWVKKFGVKVPLPAGYHPTYRIVSHTELVKLVENRESLKSSGMIVTELGDKFMLIKWERFRH
jgi:transposase-like protein